MYNFVSFVGCIGTSVTNTGLSDLLKLAFGGVEKMLSCKNFLQNTRALCICAEKILQSILQNESVFDFDSMMVLQNS